MFLLKALAGGSPDICCVKPPAHEFRILLWRLRANISCAGCVQPRRHWAILPGGETSCCHSPPGVVFSSCPLARNRVHQAGRSGATPGRHADTRNYTGTTRDGHTARRSEMVVHLRVMVIGVIAQWRGRAKHKMKRKNKHKNQRQKRKNAPPAYVAR